MLGAIIGDLAVWTYEHDLYNMDEDKFDMTDMGMCTRYFDLWNLDIVLPLTKNSKMDIPMDVLNLMEACGF